MPLRTTFLIILAAVGCTAFSPPTSRAQESPYFVTYNHYPVSYTHLTLPTILLV